jgi:hypothetical protein
MYKADNYQMIFIEAENFNKISKIILDKIKFPDIITSNEVRQDIAESIGFQYASHVNQAFAFELYIKCIMIIENGEYCYGHDPVELFSQLNIATQVRIELIHSLANKQMRRHPLYHGFMEETSFVQLLEEAGNPFMDYRYLFSKSNLKPYSLDKIIETLRTEILRLKPDIYKY